MQQGYFSTAAFDFLNELACNNQRDWFAANKWRYEGDVRAPALAFVEAMAPRLAEISPYFIANPKKAGGSLMRIHRDIRFSKDKTPYKTNIGIHFRHEGGRDVHAPGYYVHISVDEVFAGVGIWHPSSERLSRIRQGIDGHGKAWAAARDDTGFGQYFSLGGDSLKRPPRDYAKDHPLIEDIKRKDFIGICLLSPDDVLEPDFVDTIGERFSAASPFMHFLCKVLDVPY